MVTLKEFQTAPANAIFVHKDNKFGQPKAIMQFKLNQIAEAWVQGYRNRGVDPKSPECMNDVREVLKETLEHFEMQIPNIIEDTNPKKIRSKDGKGEFCHKCGLQKEGCKIVEEGDKVMKVCQECLGT